MDAILHVLQSIVDGINGPAVAMVMGTLELVLRLVPSDVPRSLLLAAGAILKGAGAVLAAAASLVDKVVPQRLK